MSEHTTRIRASDEERERVAALVRTAMSEGRLSLAEGEERLAGVYATTYRDELPGLTADLPAEPPAEPKPPPGPPRGVRAPHCRPGFGLLAATAVVATVWAVSSGRFVGPLILLGVATVLLLKRGVHRRWHHHDRAPGR